MTHVALDLAIAGATGFAAPGFVDTYQAPTFKGPRWERDNLRLRWWASTFNRLFTDHRPDVVVLEGALLLPGGRGRLSTLYLHGVCRLVAAQHRARVVELPPASLKLWATGSGAASKDAMVAAARERGCELDDHDAADAYLLYCWWAERAWVRGRSEAV